MTFQELAELPESGKMPSLNKFFNIEDLQDLHGFLAIAVIVGILYYWLVWKTTLGFDLRITGSNPIAAKFSGINPNRLIVIAMITSGGFAGLVGLAPLLGLFS
jgi:simple sugar transport system permease protein